jgi:hypothetical protein
VEGRNDTFDVVQFLAGGNMFDLGILKEIKEHSGHHHHGIDSIFLRSG